MIPKQIGRYKIKSRLGQGGLGAVYLAHDPNFGRDVALKVISPYVFNHQPEHKEEALERFRREAQVIGLLEHPAVVPVYDFGEDNEQPFIVMRLMRGGSLKDRLDQGALPLEEIVHILDDLAAALDEAHQRGIVHRDIKPHNILFDGRDIPYLADFGIAKLTEASIKFTATGASIGTPAYISPEQARGDDNLDGRSDIYSLGATLYHMLTGEHPYHKVHPIALMHHHMNEPVPRLDELRNDLPVGSQAIIDRVMAKDPNQRYDTVSAFVADVKRVLIPPDNPPDNSRNTEIEAPTIQIEVPNLNLDPLGIGSTMISPKDGMVMLYVPAGEFLMGSPEVSIWKKLFYDASDNEKPQRKIYLDAYWIDQTPVTNRMFAKFVAETGYQIELESGKEDHPVVYITWHDAQAYCEWAGRRLPTEAEWEKAARGLNGRKYPWGNMTPNANRLNFNRNIGDTTPVGHYPSGVSPYGALDMAGNVWEWTADWYAADYYKNSPLRQNPQGPAISEYKVLRGGSWNDVVQWVRAGFRMRNVPAICDADSGFRCASSA